MTEDINVLACCILYSFLFVSCFLFFSLYIAGPPAHFYMYSCKNSFSNALCIKESSCLVSFVFQMCCTSSAFFILILFLFCFFFGVFFLPIVCLFYNKIDKCNKQKKMKCSYAVFKCLMSV